MFLLVSIASCSHKKPTPESVAPLSSPAPAATPFEVLEMPDVCPKAGCSTANLNEYLNTVVMPKIRHSHVVHDCFLANPRASKKELARGHLSFDFEAKLVADGDHMSLERMTIKNYKNVPAWARPCLISAYEKFTFPPYANPRFQSTSAWGTIEISWNPSASRH